MSLWFRKVSGLDSAVMRQMAADAGVNWQTQPVIYRATGIGYKNGDASDAEAIQDAGEKLLGYRPVKIDAPPQPEPSQDLSE
jgi:hypothetical protein